MISAIKNTISEMMYDRGFHKMELVDDTYIVAENDQNKRTIVYFASTQRVSIKKMKHIKEIIENDEFGFCCLIIVCKGSVTSFAKQFITTDVNNLLVQIFTEKELMFNITKHSLVPKHDLLNSVEKRNVIDLYKTNLKHFPNILSGDPVSKYYAYVPGNLIKITRNSPNVGTFVTYRVVV